jgi:hypothetical protein
MESNCRARRQSIAGRTNGRSGRAARQRQRPSDSQYRYGFRPTLSLRISLAMQHGGGLSIHPRLSVQLYNNDGPATQPRRSAATLLTKDEARRIAANKAAGAGAEAVKLKQQSRRMVSNRRLCLVPHTCRFLGRQSFGRRTDGEAVTSPFVRPLQSHCARAPSSTPKAYARPGRAQAAFSWLRCFARLKDRALPSLMITPIYSPKIMRGGSRRISRICRIPAWENSG